MYDLIVFLPLIGFLIAGLIGNQIGPRPSEIVTTGLLGLSGILAWIAFFRVGVGGADAIPSATCMRIRAGRDSSPIYRFLLSPC
jgi:NADH:ubiquinone oxidoreductase subunit 5 (subunit L)/multisubunit Na+/H+ antiporter MnhA subunit